jgi:hypothetical protein
MSQGAIKHRLYNPTKKFNSSKHVIKTYPIVADNFEATELIVNAPITDTQIIYSGLNSRLMSSSRAPKNQSESWPARGSHLLGNQF